MAVGCANGEKPVYVRLGCVEQRPKHHARVLLLNGQDSRARRQVQRELWAHWYRVFVDREHQGNLFQKLL